MEYLAILVIVVVHGLFKLDKTINCVSSLAACAVPSYTVRVSPQGGGFQVSCRSAHASPVSKVYDIFNNETLP